MPKEKKEAKERLQNKLSQRREEKAAKEEEKRNVDEARRREDEFKTHTGKVDDETLKSIFLAVISFKHNNKNENYQIALGCFIHTLSLISESNEGGEGIFPNRVKDQIKFISSFEGKTIDLKTLDKGNIKFQVPLNISEILTTVINDIKIENAGLGSNLKLLMNEEDQKEIKHVDAKKSRRRRRVKASDATTDDPKPKPLSKLPERVSKELEEGIIWGENNTFIQAYQITTTPSGELQHPSISRSQSSPPELSR